MQQHIPIEIWEHILDYIRVRKHLKSVAVVNSYCYQVARQLLWGRRRGRLVSKVTLQQLDSLKDLPIHRLSSSELADFPENVHMFGRTLAKFETLQELELDLNSWPRHNSFTDLLNSFQQLTLLLRINLKSYEISELESLAQLDNVKEVRVARFSGARAVDSLRFLVDHALPITELHTLGLDDSHDESMVEILSRMHELGTVFVELDELTWLLRDALLRVPNLQCVSMRIQFAMLAHLTERRTNRPTDNGLLVFSRGLPVRRVIVRLLIPSFYYSLFAHDRSEKTDLDNLRRVLLTLLPTLVEVVIHSHHCFRTKQMLQFCKDLPVTEIHTRSFRMANAGAHPEIVQALGQIKTLRRVVISRETSHRYGEQLELYHTLPVAVEYEM